MKQRKFLKFILGRLKDVILLLGAVIMILPFFWVISTSFKTQKEAIAVPPTFIPENPILSNFTQILGESFILRYFLNSIIVSGTVVIVALFFCSLTGYALAKFDFPGSKLFFLMVLGKLMIPAEALIIPLYSLILKLGWSDNLIALIVPTEMISAFGIFMMRQFITNFPDSIIESARLDGCGDFGIFWKIILPNMKPAMFTLGILLFVWSWSMFLWPLIVIDSPEKMTIQIGLERFSNQYFTQYGPKMAGVLLSLLPVLTVFLIFQRRVLESVALAGLKE
jgi:ABC-type glycerol-3-phosphate transport system permease component